MRWISALALATALLARFAAAAGEAHGETPGDWALYTGHLSLPYEEDEEGILIPLCMVALDRYGDKTLLMAVLADLDELEEGELAVLANPFADGWSRALEEPGEIMVFLYAFDFNKVRADPLAAVDDLLEYALRAIPTELVGKFTHKWTERAIGLPEEVRTQGGAVTAVPVRLRLDMGMLEGEEAVEAERAVFEADLHFADAAEAPLFGLISARMKLTVGESDLAEMDDGGDWEDDEDDEIEDVDTMAWSLEWAGSGGPETMPFAEWAPWLRELAFANPDKPLAFVVARDEDEDDGDGFGINFMLPVASVAPLLDLPLTDIVFPSSSPFAMTSAGTARLPKDMEVLRGLATLEDINDEPAEDFWRKWDAGFFRRVDELRAALLAANPRLKAEDIFFDGDQEGRITSFRANKALDFDDFRPLAGLPLEIIRFFNGYYGISKPENGLRVIPLHAEGWDVLRAMPDLETIFIPGMQITSVEQFWELFDQGFLKDLEETHDAFLAKNPGSSIKNYETNENFKVVTLHLATTTGASLDVENFRSLPELSMIKVIGPPPARLDGLEALADMKADGKLDIYGLKYSWMAAAKMAADGSLLSIWEAMQAFEKANPGVHAVWADGEAGREAIISLTLYGAHRARDVSALIKLPISALILRTQVDRGDITPAKAPIWAVLRGHPTLETITHLGRNWQANEFFGALDDGSLFLETGKFAPVEEPEPVF